MLKKVFALIIVACLILFTGSVFAANNEVGDSMNKAGNTIRNVVGGTENVVENVAGDIGAGVRDLGNTFTDATTGMTNDINNTDGRYDATRTATTTNNGTVLGMNSSLWTWLVLAIAGILIVGLVWYYAVQNKNEYNNH